MKILRFLTAVALAFSLFIIPVSAFGETEKTNWYFKQKAENEQPEILGGSTVPKEHGALYLGNGNEKKIYLTFDAGYSNENVEKTLDVLNAQNVKAAFFILPGIIRNSPETVKRMIDDGHLVCNHTYSHGDMAKITDKAEFENELKRLEQVYSEAFGVEMEKYFRPPEGSFSVKTLEFCKELGYTPVFWSFAYADWDNGKQPDTEKAKAKILKSAHNGMVTLLHPTSQTNAIILDEIITELKAQGFKFCTLDELYEEVNQ